MQTVFNPHDGQYYNALDSADARAIRQGNVPYYCRLATEPVQSRYLGTYDPNTGERVHAKSAEDAYFISCGKRKWAI